MRQEHSFQVLKFMAESKRSDFLEEYWLVTFEGVVVALFIATLALIGLYWLLLITVAIKFSMIVLLVSYKRLKKETKVAVETNMGVTEPKNKESPGEVYDIVKSEYYSRNSLYKTIKTYHFSALLMLVISVLLVGYFPYDQESGHRNLERKSNEALIAAIDSTEQALHSLEEKIDNMNNLMQNVLRADNSKDSANSKKGKFITK